MEIAARYPQIVVIIPHLMRLVSITDKNHLIDKPFSCGLRALCTLHFASIVWFINAADNCCDALMSDFHLRCTIAGAQAGHLIDAWRRPAAMNRQLVNDHFARVVQKWHALAPMTVVINGCWWNSCTWQTPRFGSLLYYLFGGHISAVFYH